MLQQMKKDHPYVFLVIISIITIFFYISFVKLLIIDISPWSFTPTLIFIVIYHIIFIMMVWSTIQTIRNDPGRVPQHWGFEMENISRKYCLICHVFKPERTHHCSTCGRCVLNMDHHCPWINSCIGFYNRKHFILMLIYTLSNLFLNILAFVFSVPKLLHLMDVNVGKVILVGIICTAFIINTIAFVTVLLFFKFHINLIIDNRTTLEQLELKRQGKDSDSHKSEYTLGNYYNWVQVFGRNKCIWPFPFFIEGQGPSGDGVIWPKITRNH